MRYFVFLTVLLAMACSGPRSDKPVSTKPAAPIGNDDAVLIADQTVEDTLKGSLRARAEGQIGNARILVRYHSPAVRGRIVWGGLVPFDRVWVTGAHMATSVDVDHDITVAGQVIPAGKYGFFTIPGKETWTLVLNRNWEQHLTDEYDPQLDVIRLDVKPVIRDVHQERLQYQIREENETGGYLVVRWEKLELSLPVSGSTDR